jgi:hypothetical protein
MHHVKDEEKEDDKEEEKMMIILLNVLSVLPDEKLYANLISVPFTWRKLCFFDL